MDCWLTWVAAVVLLHLMASRLGLGGADAARTAMAWAGNWLRKQRQPQRRQQTQQEQQQQQQQTQQKWPPPPQQQRSQQPQAAAIEHHLRPWMLPPQAGPLSLPDFLQLVRQQWVLLGRGVRPLRDAELEALARRAGFVGGLSPQQVPLQPSALAAFAPWFAERLQVLAAVVPALCYPDAQLVAGLHVGRTEAADCLQCRSPGTFLLRLSSLTGHLVLSLVEEEGSAGGPPLRSDSDSDGESGRVAHYLLSVPHLRASGLVQAVMEVGACRRLLDTASGRSWPVSVLQKAARKAGRLHGQPRVFSAIMMDAVM